MIRRCADPRTLAALALMLAACGAGAKAPTASLRLRGGPPNASVTIDDRYVGSLELCAARGVALPLGKHRLTVEAAGYFPYDAIVEARQPNAPLRVDVALDPIPD